MLRKKKLTPFDLLPELKPTTQITNTQFKSGHQVISLSEISEDSAKKLPPNVASVSGIIYIFDGADFTRTATNVVYLSDLLNDKNISEIPVLIIISKCDVPKPVSFLVVDQIISFQNVLNPSRLSFLEISSTLGIGFTDIIAWISKFAEK